MPCAAGLLLQHPSAQMPSAFVSAIWLWFLQEFVTETRPTGREQERTSDRSQEVSGHSGVQVWACSVSAQLVSIVPCQGAVFDVLAAIVSMTPPRSHTYAKRSSQLQICSCRWLVPTRVCWKSRSVTLVLACPLLVSSQHPTGAGVGSCCVALGMDAMMHPSYCNLPIQCAPWFEVMFIPHVSTCRHWHWQL